MEYGGIQLYSTLAGCHVASRFKIRKMQRRKESHDHTQCSPNSHTHKLTAPSAAAPANPPRARGAPKKLPKREGPILATVTVLREEYTSVDFGVAFLHQERGDLYSRSAFSNGIRNTCINGIHCIHVLCILHVGTHTTGGRRLAGGSRLARSSEWRPLAPDARLRAPSNRLGRIAWGDPSQDYHRAEN